MPAAVSLVLRDADPSGIVVASRDNWTGKAFAMPTSDFALMAPGLSSAGVYVLTGVDETGNDIPVAYIGEGESVAERLKPGHAQLSRTDVSWQRVTVFVSQADDLHKGHVRWLESQLIVRARTSSRYRLTNGPTPSLPKLPEHDLVFLEAFLANMLTLYPLLGVDAFQLPRTPPTAPDPTATASGEAIAAPGSAVNPVAAPLTLSRAGSVVARLRTSGGTFTLLAGSLIRKIGTGSEGRNIESLRELLVENGKLADHETDWWALIDDYEVASASAAAKLVTGTSVNGLKEWRSGDACLGDLGAA